MIRHIYFGLLILIPIIPKVKVFFVAGTAILLDDLSLFIAVFLGLANLLTEASITGRLRLSFYRVTYLFGLLIIYKAVDFGLLALIYPWTDLSGVGSGVLFGEGILVLVKTSVLFAVFVLFSTELKSLTKVESVINLYLFSIVVVVVIGWAQYFILGHPILTSTFRNIYTLGLRTEVWGVEDPWFDSSATGHEQLGAYMILAVCLLGGLLLNTKPGTAIRKIDLSLFGGCIFVLVFASSRGAWIGAMCSFFAFTWFAFKKGNIGNLITIMLVVCIALFIFDTLFDLQIVRYIDTRTRDLLTIFSGEIRDDSAMHRLNTLGGLWSAFKNSILVGWGPGGAGRIAEGQYIRELVEGGLIGIGLFFGLIIKSGQVALIAYRTSENPRIRGVCLGFFCGLVGICGQALFTELLIITKVAVPFWLLAAIIHRIHSLELRESSKL